MKFLFLLLWFSVTSVQAQLVDKKSFTSPADSSGQSFYPISTKKMLLKSGVYVPLFRESSVSLPWKSLGIDLTLERNLGRSASILVGLENVYGFSRFGKLYTIEAPVELRKYFSIGKKMKQTEEQKNLFRYYVSVRVDNAIFSRFSYSDYGINEHYYRGGFVSNRTNLGLYNEWFNFFQFAYFRLGLQRKIKATNYLDVNAVIPVSLLTYNKHEYGLMMPSYISLKYGLFWRK